ncbi:hypothetical protein [Afipia birgiae]|uniref:hypothetical protein n=1 Tax=Afipia birgiae TaxID=151414 RepID=UPI00030A6F44|nr:hypothetical protein [Afipia birgiae]
MPKKASGTVICALISELRSCAEETIAVAEAADRLAKRGKAEKALRVLMDVEGPTREVQNLFRTALKVRQTLLPDPR